MNLLALFLTLVASLSLTCQAYAQSGPYRLQDGFVTEKLGKHLEIYLDSTQALTIDSLLAADSSVAWAKSEVDVPSFGYQKGNFWARFAIVEARTQINPLILEFAYSQIDYLDIYVVENNKLVQTMRAGDHLARSEWARDTRLPSFPLVPGQNTQVYIKVSGGASLQIPLVLSTEAAYTQQLMSEESFQNLYFGALIAMLAYNFLVAVGTKLRVYYFYVAFLFGYGLFQLSLSGHGSYLIWRDWLWFSDASVVVSNLIFSSGSILFSVHLLEIEKGKRFTQLFVRSFLCMAAVMLFLYPILGYSLTIKVMIVSMVIPWFLFLMTYSFLSLKEGGEVARWFVLAWFFFIVGGLITALRVTGLIPSTNFTQNAQQMGSVVEFILLSFALAQRIKSLQKRIQIEQEHALEAEKRAREADAKALAEERRLNEQRDQLVANTSHELRTPLNGMMGLIQAIIRREGDKLSSDTKRSLQGIVQSGQRLAALIGDLLDFSRGQRGSIPLYRGSISVRDSAQQVVDILTPTLEGRPVEISLYVPDDLPPVYVDPNRLQQILFNLTGNSCKFTEKGKIEIAAKQDGDRVIITVEDTGSGIPAEAQARIFEAFTQADGGIARRYGGTGLGLAIVKQLVEAHGGEVGVQSMVGYGSTFWFSLPVCHDNDNITESAKASLENHLITLLTQIEAGRGSQNQLEIADTPTHEVHPHHAADTNLEILVVDDEPMNRQVLQEMLSLCGHHVTLAADGHEALRLVGDMYAPHLILLDIMMPGLSGIEVLKTLRKRFNEAELPIILLSAKALEKDRLEGFRAGASVFVLKPFMMEEIEARITHQARLKEAIWSSQSAREEGTRLRQQLLHTEDQLMHAERLASIGAATAGIAHDLGNPIHHIQTVLVWLRNRTHKIETLEALPAPAYPELESMKETIDLADKAAQTAHELTQAIRIAVRTDQGTTELVRLRDVIHDVEALLHHKLRYLQFSADCQDNLAIRGKRSEMIQLVMNLLSNAADALSETEDKKLLVRVTSDGAQIRLSVEDSGPGVPEKIRSLIFEPFYTTKPTGKGTGLGLAVVKAVTKRAGGELELDSSPELGGARFTVLLPAA